MTPKEHQLMILLFAIQMGAFKALLDILRDKGIVREKELSALYAAAWSVNAEKEALLSQARAQYAAYAKILDADIA